MRDQVMQHTCNILLLCTVAETHSLSPPPLSYTHTIQLLEELHEKEQNCQSLQNYAGLLLQRITEQSPDLLQSIGSHHEQYSELLMAEQ